jgi:chromosome segregation ATPase
VEVALVDVTNELMYESMKKMHQRFDKLDTSIGELKAEMNNFRGHMLAMQGDIKNIYAILGRHDDRLDRIENRLELRELAEAQAKFRHDD